MELKKMTFVAACKQFFGARQGQSLMDFLKEIRELTEQDKADLIAMFRTVGIDATLVS